MKYVLYISGLGQETKPHEGLKELSQKIEFRFGWKSVFRSYKDKLNNLTEHNNIIVPSVVIGHSLGAVKCELFKDVCPLVVLDPVRWPWYFNRSPVKVGFQKTLLIRQSGWFPPSVDTVGTDVEKHVLKLDHNELVKNDDNQKYIIDWISKNVSQ